MTQLKQVVATYVRDRLKELETDPNDGRVRAQLAILRHGVGRKPGDMPELWGLFFAEMNPLMFSQDGEPTPAEWAAYTALTLYAVHQQGRNQRRKYAQRGRGGVRVRPGGCTAD